MADIQAILWYYEKRLHGELGSRQSAEISYKKAARIAIAEFVAAELDRANRPDAPDVGEQSRSEAENGRATESQVSGEIRASRPRKGVSGPRFVSPLAQAIEGARMEQQPSQQWKFLDRQQQVETRIESR